MAKMTRRAMLWATSAGVATLSGVAAVFVGNQHSARVEAAGLTSTGAATSGSLAAYVKNVQSGTVSILVGEREVIINNPDLVRALLKAAQ